MDKDKADLKEMTSEDTLDNYRGIFQDRSVVFTLVLIGVLIVIMWLIQPFIAILAAIGYGFIIYDSLQSEKRKREEFVEYIESLGDKFESTARKAIFNMGFPLVLLDEADRIHWYNGKFLEMVDGKDVIGQRVRDLIEELKGRDFSQDGEFNIEYNNKGYRVYPNVVESKDGLSTVIYFVDDTEYQELLKKYNDEEAIVALVYVDNYNDIRDSTEEADRPTVLAEIDKTIQHYFRINGGLIRKYDRDKFVTVFKKSFYKEMQENNFTILDQVKELELGINLPVTLSIGISLDAKNLNEAYLEAKNAIDVALGRGGDQVVVKRDTEMKFYGGKSQAQESRSRVRARVMGYAIREFIENADKVFVMGHERPDMDSFGSAIGTLSIVNLMDKEGYLVLDEVNPSIKYIYQAMEEEEPEMLDCIVNGERALELATDKSLVIMVDNHKPSMAESPELIEKVEKVIVIDHHRRGEEFVDDPLLVYLEPYASSASELVTEILAYIGDELKLSPFQAEALLAGITVDTKNFTFQTGVRTFEAASTLKRFGADSSNVSKFFRNDLNTFVYKAEVMSSAEVINDIMAIGVLDRTSDNTVLVAAQAADSLLTIDGIEASFVLTHSEEKIHISGRSRGEISVQLILERIGGGGHLTSAGVQLEMTMDEAKELLINTIKEYMEEK